MWWRDVEIALAGSLIAVAVITALVLLATI